MKNLSLSLSVCVCVFVMSGGALAQSTDQTALSARNAGLTVTRRGPDDRVWAKLSYQTNADDSVTVTTNLAFTEVSSGIHYWDAEWKESEDRIDLTTDGRAEATRGPWKLHLNSNLNGPEPPISWTSRRDRTFKTRPIGLFYHDTSSGRVVELGLLQDCRGKLLPPNQIVWESILKGIRADLRVTYTAAAGESDLILLERPKSPNVYGLNPDTTRLELWHQWQAPTPAQRLITIKRPSGAEIADTLIDFGEVLFPLGRGFSCSGEATRPATTAARVVPMRTDQPNSVPVSKEWHDGKDFSVLVEAVHWKDLEPQLAVLPEVAASEKPPAPKDRLLCLREASAGAVRTTTNRGPIEVASAPYAPQGYVLDYPTVHSADTYYFSAGTYNVEYGYIRIAYFWANCVLKFPDFGYLIVYGNAVCYGSYGTQVLTSKDDDLFGEVAPDSTHTPTYSAAGLWVYYPPQQINDLQGFKFRWCHTGLRYDDSSDPPLPCNLRMSRFELCQTAIVGGVTVSLSKYCGVQRPDPGLENDCTGDADGDSLPDVWEVQYFKSKTAAIAGDDTDGDCLTNGDEFTAGSNPRTWLIPQFTTQPAPAEQMLYEGDGFPYCVTVTPACCKLQWYKNEQPIVGATSSTLNLVGVTAAAYNGATITVKATSDLNTTTSTPVKLWVLNSFWGPVYDTFAQQSVGKTANVRGMHEHPQGWPNVKPRLTWHPTGLLKGKLGSTAISLCNSWCSGAETQAGVTALTRRHGYMRGHGTGPCPCGIHAEPWDGQSGWAGRKVWFKPDNDNPDDVVEAEVAAAYISNPDNCCSGEPDFTIVIFKDNLPSSITPLRVMTPPSGPWGPYHVTIQTCQHGLLRANYPGFDWHTIVEGGDSGSPHMILIPNLELIFYGGTATSGISQTMQNHMNSLSSGYGGGTFYQLDCYSPCGLGCFSVCPQ